MNNNSGKGAVIGRMFLAMLAFSIFIKLDSLFGVTDVLVGRGWSLLPIIAVIVLLRLTLAGFVVLVILPPILGFGRWRDWLPQYLRFDRKIMLVGGLSFAAFAVLAAALAGAMGIFAGDLGAVFAFPDINPDPDVVGWGYFLLALVPGIWEELAFRGIIQTRARSTFTTGAAIFLSSLFFGLFHFSGLVTQTPAEVVPGVIMAFLFGIGWGYLTVRARSVVPAIIAHYLVDSLGQIFITVDSADPALTTGFFLLLTLLYPLLNVILARLAFPDPAPPVTSALEF